MHKIDVYITEEKIRQRVSEIASSVKKDFGNEVFCGVILKGAMVFFSDLMRTLRKSGASVKFDILKVSSYADTASTGKLNFELDMKEDVKGKDILIVEDIADTGLTLHYLKKHLLSRGAKSVKICVLLDKKERRRQYVDLDYVGFEIPDEFVVGYGLDYNQQYRDLSFIGILHP